MKKKINCEKGALMGVDYVSPEVEVVEIGVEQGFAASNETLGEDEGEW